MTDATFQRKLDQLLFEINDLRVTVKRTETRMCALAQFLGAGHIGAPNKVWDKRHDNQRKETTV
jgi:hypothetical protein